MSQYLHSKGPGPKKFPGNIKPSNICMKNIQFQKFMFWFECMYVQIFSCEAMDGRTGRWHYFVHKVTCSMIQRGWMKPVFTSLWRRNKKDSSWFPHIMYAITKSKIVPPIYCCLVQFAMLIYYCKSIESLRASRLVITCSH